MNGGPTGRIPTERMNAGTPRTSSPDAQVCWKEKPVDQCGSDFQKLNHSIGQEPGVDSPPISLLPVNSALNPPPEAHSSGGKYKSIPTASLRNTVAVEIGSHRRSGKGTSKKTNRAALFSQPTGWLFFCRSERRRATYRTGCGREWN